MRHDRLCDPSSELLAHVPHHGGHLREGAAALHGPASTGQRLYAGVALFAALGGAATAGRQVWLQNIPPDQLPSCLPRLEYMREALPFQEIVRQVLHGTADCAEVGWTLFGMSLPEWSLLAFVAMILFTLLQLLRQA